MMTGAVRHHHVSVIIIVMTTIIMIVSLVWQAYAALPLAMYATLVLSVRPSPFHAARPAAAAAMTAACALADHIHI